MNTTTKTARSAASGKNTKKAAGGKTAAGKTATPKKTAAKAAAGKTPAPAPAAKKKAAPESGTAAALRLAGGESGGDTISAAYREQLTEDRSQPASKGGRKTRPQSATVVATSSANSTSADPDARHRVHGEPVRHVTRHI